MNDSQRRATVSRIRLIASVARARRDGHPSHEACVELTVQPKSELALSGLGTFSLLVTPYHGQR
jgi:hypothetical protein